MGWSGICAATPARQTLRLFISTRAPREEEKCSNVPFHQAFAHSQEPVAEADPAGNPANPPNSQNCGLTGVGGYLDRNWFSGNNMRWYRLEASNWLTHKFC